MYAIIKQDGRQYKVEEGQEIDIDYRDASAGDKLTFGEVLAVGGEQGLQFGAPLLSGASVAAEVLGVRQGDKLVVQKFRKRKGFRKRNGHRQLHTRVKIGKISGI